MLAAILAFAGGYSLGSIPFAFVITKLFGLGDIRQVGSGNVGTTNVLRTGNKLAAALTLIGDVGKGIVAVLIAKQFGDIPAMAAGLGAFTGHIFPVWLNFKGGKGLATYIGILAALSFPIACIVGATWITTALISRISSVAALVAAALSPVYMLIFDRWQYAVGSAILAALIFVTHRDNIRRLLKGEEPRIGEKKPSASADGSSSTSP
ncbi:MAG: glycerol-3-phosphate 1-O-acyltransferase PlsY [Alphaproteobacteria bacterium]|jgi:glycerol-3-phosphate acyltransferase PlsY|nr:glycerol-3-phosphate 1-O-acyltransferase PlsY [Alphaproteobacteria bacterium]